MAKKTAGDIAADLYTAAKGRALLRDIEGDQGDDAWNAWTFDAIYTVVTIAIYSMWTFYYLATPFWVLSQAFPGVDAGGNPNGGAGALRREAALEGIYTAGASTLIMLVVLVATRVDQGVTGVAFAAAYLAQHVFELIGVPFLGRAHLWGSHELVRAGTIAIVAAAVATAVSPKTALAIAKCAPRKASSGARLCALGSAMIAAVEGTLRFRQPGHSMPWSEVWPADMNTGPAEHYVALSGVVMLACSVALLATAANFGMTMVSSLALCVCGVWEIVMFDSGSWWAPKEFRKPYPACAIMMFLMFPIALGSSLATPSGDIDKFEDKSRV
eukprot:TRINITY_DN3806_c0_g1_i1.p1 TRINITY_DN3806_c0_g1~~TRINITY_DN3806_c0_g1_i1.p1  ORF type:complete len:328 (+),score=45.50 TRINITY_DN3806_c0_g1_i1:67-1050(+)